MEAPNFSQPEAQTRQEILDAFSKGHESAKSTLNKMDDAMLMSPWTLTKNGRVIMSIPKIGFIRSIMLNHIYPSPRATFRSHPAELLDVPVPSICGPSGGTKIRFA